MTVMLPALLLVSWALSLPAWPTARARGDSRWVLFLAVPAAVVWILVTSLGLGGQSLSNLVELLGLAAAGPVVCWVKVFGVDRRVRRPRRSTAAAAGLLVLAALLLRALMPTLPE